MSGRKSVIPAMMRAMKKGASGLGVSLMLLSFSTDAGATHVSFDEKDLGRFPAEWRARGQGGKDVYSVQRDRAGAFLHAESIANAHTIGRDLSVDLAEYPFLSFSWRAVDLPEGGREGIRETNDGALGVYVIFEGWSMPPRTIKYVWSSSLPKGTVTTSPFSSKSKVVVLRSGDAALGVWLTEKVNVLDDYQRLFDDTEPQRVKGIGILTDSDNTGTQAAGDYRFFRFLKATDKLAAEIR